MRNMLKIRTKRDSPLPTPHTSLLKTLLLFMVLVWMPYSAHANPQMEKGIKHFKDFEIKQGLKIFKQLEGDSSLSQSMKAKVALYMAMSYAYLRNKSKALQYFQTAIKRDPNVQLPKGTPSRLRKMFKQAKASSGGIDSYPAPGARSRPTPPPSTTPPVDTTPAPQRTEPPPAVDTTPAPQRTEPPPRHRFSFGNFSIKRAAPRSKPVADPSFPQARSTRKRSRRTRQRRVAQADPTLGDPDPSIGSKIKPRSGGNALMVAAWVTAGLAVAMAGVGFAMGALAGNKASLATSPQTYQVDLPEIQKDANSSALIANMMFIGAGATAITSVILFIVASKGKSKASKTSVDAVSLQNNPLSGSPKTLSSVPPPAKTIHLFSSP